MSKVGEAAAPLEKWLHLKRAASRILTAQSISVSRCRTAPYTDKKRKSNFPQYKEIQNGAVAKSYMTNGLLLYGEIFAHLLIY